MTLVKEIRTCLWVSLLLCASRAVVNSHVCQVRGHKFDAHWSTPNDGDDQPHWLIRVIKSGSRKRISHRGGSKKPFFYRNQVLQTLLQIGLVSLLAIEWKTWQCSYYLVKLTLFTFLKWSRPHGPTIIGTLQSIWEC